MFPISLYRNGSSMQVGASEFRESLIEICRQHQEEGRALVFVFLLFDRQHPRVRRVLADDYFYEALDAISGCRLTVFFIHSPTNDVAKKRTQRDPVLDDAGHEAIETIQDALQLRWDTSKPAMFFFQVQGANISHGCLVLFEDENPDETFSAMRDLLRLAGESLANVEPEYKSNFSELFYLVEDALKNRDFKRRFVANYKVVKEIRDWIY
jgi:hypothetical protein